MTDSLLLDSLLVLPSTIHLSDSTQSYSYNPKTGYLRLNPPPTDSITVEYSTIALRRQISYAKKDSTMIRNGDSDDYKPFVFQNDLLPQTSYEQGDLVKAGSIARGISFGNSQDLAVNSNLNLQLSGKITERFSVLASITDDNIPIQPDGNTQQLQDFDQVYIQVFDDQTLITAGDFQITEREDHFLRYQKRARGGTASYQWSDSIGTYEASASAAISKGKFARNIIQGVEGNQGPYRLIGAENERFIIIMAGTERVFIDGKLLQRGQAFDYTIDYNTAEVTFTPKNLITKDRRIVVEFQYADRNYARSLLQGEIKGEQGKYSWFVHALAEQDSKNQPLQQDLDVDDRTLLSNVGDDVLSAVNSAIDSVGFTDDQVLYALIDTLGYDSVLVLSNNSETALYRAVFSLVGAGNGDYVEDGFGANGRVYRWVAPDTVNNVLVRNGDHAPVRQLVSPKKRQMITGGGKITWSEDHQLYVEAAITSRDDNTFSTLDAADNSGLGIFTDWRIQRSLSRNKDSKAKWGVRVFQEYISENFSEIERFRSVEFDRDWNVRDLVLSSDQHVGGVAVQMNNSSIYSVSVEASTFQSGSGFTGYRGSSFIRYAEKGRKLNWQGSATQSDGLRETNYLRQKTDLAIPVGPVRIGYIDDFEWNRFFVGDSLALNSYRFHEWQGWLGSLEEQAFKWKLFYSERTDRLPLSSDLVLATQAEAYGVEGGWTSKKQRRISWNVSQRRLSVVDSALTTNQPEETLLGRLEGAGSFFNNILSGQVFYQTGSGLEQARQFIYIEVPAGQGNYIWVDYNGDGIRDLNEFEIANFAYEANYIRTFVPSDEYLRTFTNQFTANAQFQPARAWANETGTKKFISRFSNAASIRLDRKTTDGEGWERLNPLESGLADTSLISLGSSLRNTLSFDRSNPNFGLEYTYQDLGNKALLANGFETRSEEFNEVKIRKSILSEFTLIVTLKEGTKSTSSDFLTGRNYMIDYTSASPELQWQPSNTFRVTLNGRWVEKVNEQEGTGESSRIADIGLAARFSDPGKGLFEARFNWLDIAFDGTANNTLAFELLEGLQPGRNATWQMSIQRSISRTLQLNLLYNGRTAADTPAVHVGSVQVRATF
ncbi:hypothetical protein [Sanyastnella coralliicola]|uniref:hypothetical protein n=1 Tax=Sanyastnella coralliicola TaxID=3069118 RepID=UPI0027B8B607|nr:hypothetical protein [Longitalea sp. SCSIO 12813]